MNTKNLSENGSITENSVASVSGVLPVMADLNGKKLPKQKRNRTASQRKAKAKISYVSYRAETARHSFVKWRHCIEMILKEA